MALMGIERVIYCVEDVSETIRFFTDFGLTRTEDHDAGFVLPDQSLMFIQALESDPVPGSEVSGPGVHEVVWGVDTPAQFEVLIRKIEVDRPVRRDAEGIAHFVADGGIAMGLRHWPEKRAIVSPTDPINSPGHINRMNVHRRWITRARPRWMEHVVYACADFDACRTFMMDRLGFRLSDIQRGFGVFLRCDGTYHHHNLFLQDSSVITREGPVVTRFNHLNFAVTDLDEIMIGKQHMERCGWKTSEFGLGRHRISSSLFLYFPCPAGGEAEYGADSDALDDNWIPRDFDRKFGRINWTHDNPAGMLDGSDWDVVFAKDYVP